MFVKEEKKKNDSFLFITHNNKNTPKQNHRTQKKERKHTHKYKAIKYEIDNAQESTETQNKKLLKY